MALLVAILVAACADSPSARAAGPESKRVADYYDPNCGVSYTMVTDEYDDLMADFGIGSTSDTVNVCETWTGSDYALHAQTVGSADFSDDATFRVQGGDYAAGYVTPYNTAGSPVQSADGTSGTTAFDLMDATADQVQASYDDPYYGIMSPADGQCTQNCLQSREPITRPLQTNRTPGSASLAAAPAQPFTRHGLNRPGVRALVDGAEEITASAPGTRQFQVHRGKVTKTYTVDSHTGLLVGEDEQDSTSHTVTTHAWRLENGYYVRSRTDVVGTDFINGRARISRAAISFMNVHRGAAKLPGSGGTP